MSVEKEPEPNYYLTRYGKELLLDYNDLTPPISFDQWLENMKTDNYSPADVMHLLRERDNLRVQLSELQAQCERLLKIVHTYEAENPILKGKLK